MKFKNKITTLSSAIAALTLIYILGAIFSAENIYEKRSQEKIFDIALMETVSSLTVTTNEGPAEIEKTDGVWMISIGENKYPASEYKIDNFLDSVFSLTKYQVVGDDSKYWKNFDLEENKVKSVVLRNSDNKEIYSLYLGKSGPAGRGEYIRSSLSDESYLTDASIKRYFSKDLNYWSRLRILSDDLDSESIIAMNIVSDVVIGGELFKGKLNLKKENAEGNYEWINPEDKKKFQRSKADTIANNISSLVADSYTEDTISFNDIVIEVASDKHGIQVIDLQKKNDKQFLIHIRGGKYTYLINQYKVNRIISRLE